MENCGYTYEFTDPPQVTEQPPRYGSNPNAISVSMYDCAKILGGVLMDWLCSIRFWSITFTPLFRLIPNY